MLVVFFADLDAAQCVGHGEAIEAPDLVGEVNHVAQQRGIRVIL